MGIVQTIDWKFLCPPQEAVGHLAGALSALDMNPQVDGDTVSGAAARSMRRNRWASTFTATARPDGSGSIVSCSVDMLGDKHTAVLDEIAEQIDEGVLDDRGLRAGIAKVSKIGRLAGRKELRHLAFMLRSSERVLALGQGEYQKKQGIVVLTNERLFFFEKGVVREQLEEFMLGSISSLEAGKKMTGDRLTIHASGNAAEISHLDAGAAEEISNCFRDLRRSQSAQPPSAPAAIAPPAPAADPLAQLEKLAELRDRGVLTAEEFEAKKAELLGRL